MKRYSAIVVGCGGLGTAALYRLSLRLGADVLGIERFGLGHDRGASDDHSRIIRLAQHEPQYGALSPAAYAAWREVEEASGQRIVTLTGGLVIEDRAHRENPHVGNRNIDGYANVLAEAGVAYEALDATALSRRWPQFRLDGDERAIYQRDSGIVDARKSIAVHAALARANGAEIVEHTPVRSLRPLPEGVEVRTDAATYLADRVVVAADAWTGQVLEGCGVRLPLTVTQEQVTYYATAHLRDFAPDRFPVFMWHGAHNFYGFPVYGEVATKLGQHMGGPEVNAETRTFTPDSVPLLPYREFLDAHVPGFTGPELYTKTCLYTIPPDQNFVLDTLPDEPRVAVAVGAGHAFKFAALIGAILSDLALDGTTEHPVDAFSLTRPAITDRTFARAFHA